MSRHDFKKGFGQKRAYTVIVSGLMHWCIGPKLHPQNFFFFNKKKVSLHAMLLCFACSQLEDSMHLLHPSKKKIEED